MNSDTTTTSLCASLASSEFAIDVKVGSRIESRTTGWTPLSKCPDGYVVTGWKDMDNFGHEGHGGGQDINHFKVQQKDEGDTGAMVYYYGSAGGSSEALCSKIVCVRGLPKNAQM